MEGEGLLDAAGQALSPGKAAGQMLAVVDLDQREVIAVEAATPSMDKRCLHFGLPLIERLKLDDIKAPAVNVPFVKHGDEAAHGMALPISAAAWTMHRLVSISPRPAT